MLLNYGELDGVRLLSPKTIELMTSSHTADLPPGGLLGAAGNFGLGFRVTVDLGASQTLGSTGMYGWGGIYGTNFWVDPKENLIAVVMVQRYPGSTVAGAFQALTYQALTRSSYIPTPKGAEGAKRTASAGSRSVAPSASAESPKKAAPASSSR
jgi:CubicO group peptidase (beta-lactamase class C family)